MRQNPSLRWSRLLPHPRPLREVFADMPDVRNRRGTRHPLPAILALACGAMRCGDRRDSAIAAWGRNDGSRIAQALDFTHLPPCAATLHVSFRRLDGVGCEAQLGAWAESVVASTPGGTDRPQASEPAVALAGNTLRGSRKQGAPGVHLLSALAHQVGVTLPQQAGAEKTNGSTAVETGMGQMVLKGRMVTLDALLTQTAVAPTIVDAGGACVMIVKATQPQRRSDSELIFAEPPVGDPQETAETLEEDMDVLSSGG